MGGIATIANKIVPSQYINCAVSVALALRDLLLTEAHGFSPPTQSEFLLMFMGSNPGRTEHIQ